MLKRDTYVAVDLETTGLSPVKDRILEIGAYKIVEGKIADRFCSLVNPEIEISEKITQLTGITGEMVRMEPGLDEVLPSFLAFCGDMDLLGHQVLFDYSFLKQQAAVRKLPFEKKGIDTLQIARTLLPDLESRRLGDLCEYFQIDLVRAHRADSDALAAHELFLKLKDRDRGEHADLFVAKELMFQPKKQSPATKFQKAYLKDLMKYHKIELHVCVDALTKSEASKMIDKTILEYGRMIK